jgi:restriction endonuclease S subunit
MQSNYFWDGIDRIAVGSLSKTINWGDIAKYKFLIPSIKQQNEIVILFSEIEKTHKSYIEFDLQLKVTWRNLEELLLKNSNTQHTLGALAEINPPSTSTKGLAESFLYIDISSINGESEIEIDKLQRFCFPDAPSRAQRLVTPGDILVSTVRPLQKSITVVPETDQVLVASSGVAVLKPKNNASRNMINAIIYGDCFTQSMQSKSTGSSYPAIKPRDIQEFRIPDPTAIQNINIVNQIVSVMEMISDLRQEVSELMNLKNVLLREIFQGTVTAGKENA